MPQFSEHEYGACYRAGLDPGRDRATCSFAFKFRCGFFHPHTVISLALHTSFHILQSNFGHSIICAMVNQSTSPRHNDPSASYRTPRNIIGKAAFQLLCIIALSRTRLEYWEDPEGEWWKEHVKVTKKRFHYSNITV